MAKTILGIDIGYETLKLVLVNGKQIKKAVKVNMPESLVREGKITSPEAMAEFLKQTMKENGVRAKNAAVVIPNEQAYVRTITIPQMTAEQLEVNLPYEFRDYITGELKDYIYDYAVVSTPEEIKASYEAKNKKDKGETPEDEDLPEAPVGLEDTSAVMDIMAVAASVEYVETIKDILRKAGLKLVKLAPAVSAYISLIRTMNPTYKPESGEYCIVDLGYQAIRMHIFKGDRHVVTRELEVGLSALSNIIADAYNVDIHVAHTYLTTNYDDCRNKDVCKSTYDNIAVELMRAINFFRFSNPDSHLEDLWITGGGAVIVPLVLSMEESLDLKLHPASELVNDNSELENYRSFIPAIGITQD